MKTRISLVVAIVILLFSCTPYVTPYLSLDLRTDYTTADIAVNYTYECEEQEQRCVVNLYSTGNPSVPLYSRDEVMPSTGVLDFSGLGLGEGDYRLEFSIYSEKDGEYSLLKFLDESYEFSIDFP